MRKFWQRKPKSMGPHIVFKVHGDTKDFEAKLAGAKQRAELIRNPKPRTPFAMVREFHQTYGQPIGLDGLRAISDERMELRWALIHEEYLEVSEAIDNCIEKRDWPSLTNLLKELADLIYVVEGFAVELGVDLDEIVAEVHRSNMSKLGADGKPIYREDGKVLKGEGYFEPDLESIVLPENNV